MQITDVLQRYKDDLKTVEEYLEKNYSSYIQIIPEVTDYIINSGGKRFRPLLLMIASDLCGYTGERRYPMAAVTEFLHTASLLHDDIIDHADTRRGQAAANNVWGNSVSVLVGDFLYSQAFSLMIKDGDPSVQKVLTDAAITMVEGETFQLTKCGDINITGKEYLSVIENKTAVLISAACTTGALLAKAPQTTIDALSEFGMKLGIAFQLIDDTLDYVATEEEFGKTIGMDLKEGKITLPLIRTLKNCSPAEKKSVINLLENKNINGDDIQEIVSLINKHKAIDYSLNIARTYIREAKALLEPFDDSFPKEALLTISDYTVERRL
jgi:octaprenyl-diphosphate synthase